METREVRRVHRMRDHLETHGWPRLNCMLMVAVATAAAFLTSVVLLFAFDVRSMPLRYGAAALAGYLTFILMIRAWVWRNHREMSVDPDFDVIDGVSQLGPPGLPDVGGVSLDLDLDDLVWILIALAIVFAAGAATVYVIYLAPTLLAEALVDVLIAGGIYRGLRRHDSTHWTIHVFQRTAVPAAIVIVSAVLAGYALQRVAPGARSIGAVWASLSQ